jgi:hypothetical protein
MKASSHYWKSIMFNGVMAGALYFTNHGTLACIFSVGLFVRVLEATIFSAIIEARYYTPTVRPELQ